MERPRSQKGQFLPIHGGKRTRLYRVWMAMRERCNNPHNKSFKNYGGRGISVCREWDDYGIFHSWAISSGYAPGLTIDRIDYNGDYSPANCRWVTTWEQNRNYSRNKFITFHGRTQCLSDWADELGIKRATLSFRLKSGMDLERAFLANDYRRSQ